MTRKTFHFDQALLADGWADNVRLTIGRGDVAAIESDTAAQPDDERHAVALPGLPNVHSHAFQRGMAGLAEMAGDMDDSFWTWRETMYRFVRRIDPDDLLAIAAMAYVEMLETGFTRVGEFHYLHHDLAGGSFDDPGMMSRAIFEAVAETGIALTHLPVFYAHGGFGGLPPAEGQRRFVHDIDSYRMLLDSLRQPLAELPDAVLGVAPHSLRAVTLDELQAVTAASGDGPVHIHIAEQLKEVDDCLAWSGQRPVEWLLSHMAIDRRWCLVHATHMTDQEAANMAAHDAVAGLCPVTEANLGDGLFNKNAFIGGLFGVGSDSNVLIDAVEELRWLEYGQRLHHRRRNVITGLEGSTGGALYRGAWIGGSRALGGALSPSRSADFITLDMDHVSLADRRGDAILDGLIFAAGRQAIDGVWRRGRQVVARGRHVDRDRIATRYRATLKELLA